MNKGIIQGEPDGSTVAEYLRVWMFRITDTAYEITEKNEYLRQLSVRR